MSDQDIIQTDMSDELDNALLQAVKGVKKVLSEEFSIKDLRGAAAVLNVARQRLRDLGMGKDMKPGSQAGRLSEELGDFNVPLSEDIDAASTEEGSAK